MQAWHFLTSISKSVNFSVPGPLLACNLRSRNIPLIAQGWPGLLCAGPLPLSSAPGTPLHALSSTNFCIHFYLCPPPSQQSVIDSLLFLRCGLAAALCCRSCQSRPRDHTFCVLCLPLQVIPAQFSTISLMISWIPNLLCNHQNMVLNNASALAVINYFLLSKLLFGFPWHYSLLFAPFLSDPSFLGFSNFPIVNSLLAQGYIPGNLPFPCCSVGFDYHTR